MLIHLFANNLSYPSEAANFLASNFPEADQVFVFRSWKDNGMLGQEAMKQVMIVDSKSKLLRELSPLLKKADHVIFHSFTKGIPLLYWRFAIRWIRKTSLAVYGTELYWWKYARKTPWNRFQEGLRRRIFFRFDQVITIIEKDAERFRELYAPGVRHVKAFVPIPGELNKLRCEATNHENLERLVVLVGNSATPTNRHKEVFELLDKLPYREQLHITCPLSYGDMDYAREVEALGKGLFGERFKALRAFLPAEEYLEGLYQIDLCIMNHDRQQALGNIFTLLCMGKTVMISDDNPTLSFFREEGMELRTTASLKDSINLLDLLLEKKDALRNHERMKHLLSDAHYREMWGPILSGNDSGH